MCQDSGVPVAHSRTILDRAVAESRAVAAFNVITLEHAEAIVAGAEKAGSPVILQLSENAIRFHGGPRAIAAAMVAVAQDASVEVVLHLDHITDPALALRTAELGFSSVMFDGATLPFDENVTETRRVAEWCHANDIWVEAELGEVGGKDGAHAPGVRTDPAEAAEFVAATGVDALAVAVGSSHAMTEKSAALDHDLIGRLRASVPVPLVLHGSSGVPDHELAEAARSGMVKINIGTALNVAFTGAVRSRLDEEAKLVDPRKYIAPARDAMAAVVGHALTVLS